MTTPRRRRADSDESRDICVTCYLRGGTPARPRASSGGGSSSSSTRKLQGAPVPVARPIPPADWHHGGRDRGRVEQLVIMATYSQ